MAEDGKVIYKTEIDNSDATKQAEDAGNSLGKKFGSAAAGIGKAFAGASIAAVGAMATATVAIGKQAIQNYAAYEQLTSGVETLFKDQKDTVIQYAAEAFKTAGMSANEYMTTVTGFSASLLQSLGGDTKQAADMANMAITDMADNANKMGTDMESIQYAYRGFAKQNYTINNLMSAA